MYLVQVEKDFEIFEMISDMLFRSHTLFSLKKPKKYEIIENSCNMKRYSLT
jgi:hypothetical protein